jgi:hypothetical protein
MIQPRDQPQEFPRISLDDDARMNFLDVLNVVLGMSTISMMRTGHHRLADGSLLRVDIELGRWVGSLYTRDMRVKTRVVGSDVEVHAWADSMRQRNKLAA